MDIRKTKYRDSKPVRFSDLEAEKEAYYRKIKGLSRWLLKIDNINERVFLQQYERVIGLPTNVYYPLIKMALKDRFFWTRRVAWGKRMLELNLLCEINGELIVNYNKIDVLLKICSHQKSILLARQLAYKENY